MIMIRTTILALALLLATPAQAADGKWTCALDQYGRNSTHITVSGGKVLQVMPDGTKLIPDKVIDFGQTVVWVYEFQEFELDTAAARMVETQRWGGAPSDG